MAALTKNVKRAYVDKQREDQPFQLNVAAGEEIFLGAIVALDASGDAIAAPATQDAEFAGISASHYDNSGGALTTDRPVYVYMNGKVRLACVPAATAASLKKPVYYLNDNEVTLVAPLDTTTRVGTIEQIYSNGDVLVDTSKDFRVLDA